MENLFDFTGKVAVITGGSRGLGRQMALAYAARGADLVIASRKLENCESVVGEIEAMGRQGLALSIDATQWDAMDELTQRPMSISAILISLSTMPANRPPSPAMKLPNANLTVWLT